MRPGKGCMSCRERHIKCVTEPDQTVCTRCQEAERECVFGPKFRFRQVAHVDSGGANRQDLSYDQDQVWVSTRKNFSWVLEDGSGLEYGVPEDENTVTAPAASQKPPKAPDLPRKGAPISEMLISEPSPEVSKRAEIALADSISDFQSATGLAIIPPIAITQCEQTSHPSAHLDFESPASIEELTRRHQDERCEETSPLWPTPLAPANIDVATPSSVSTPGTLARTALSRREAYLVQHYIRKISPWLDVCDLSLHFAYELPRRAMHRPMVLFAILALSSRHLALLNKQTEPPESSFYHGQCLRLVIDQMSGPEALYDDNLIATVVCLRVFEEIEHSTDAILHLRGVDRMLRAIPTFAHSGGLGEAACWQAVRQDAYISMVRGVPPHLDLENFERSAAFTFRDDAACANVVILLFSKILRLVYAGRGQADLETWDGVSRDVEAWNDRRFRLFQPIYFEDTDLQAARPFPVILMISPPQVAALQYYHACKVYMLLHKPLTEPVSAFVAAKRRRETERDVVYHLSVIVGLAESNPSTENANFTATHLLRMAGYCIASPLQRQKAIGFLQRIEHEMGWSTSLTVALLTEQWMDLDCNE